MELTKEIAQKKLEEVKANTEGFLQGFAQGLSFAIQIVETPEPKKAD
jgi:hypothetical protein